MPVDRIASLMANLSTSDVALLSPVERRRFVDLCDRWAKAAREMEADRIVREAIEATTPKSGVLHDLRDGRGRQ